LFGCAAIKNELVCAEPAKLVMVDPLKKMLFRDLDGIEVKNTLFGGK
jgi:hypothetical protein